MTRPNTNPLQHTSYAGKGEPAYGGDLFKRIIDWEQNQLSETETLRLFQELVDCGLAWKSTGAVRRTASLLIQEGRIKSEFAF